MKVLLVTNGYPPRGRFGTEFYSRELVRGLVRRGHEPLVLHPVRSGGRPRYSVEEVTEEGVRVLLLHNSGDRKKRFAASYSDAHVDEAFARILERHRPDLVHFVYLGWGLSFGLPVVAREHGIPTLATLTDYGLFCHRGQMFDHTLERCFGPHPPERCARCIREPSAYDLAGPRLALKRAAVRTLAALGGAGKVVTTADVQARESAVRSCIEAVRLFVAPTRSLADVAERGGVPAERLVCLPYAFDEAPYAVARDVPAGPRRLGFVGQIAPHKGVATLLEAARLLDGDPPEGDWEIVLFGTPSVGRHAAFAPAMLREGLPPRTRVAAPFAPDEAPAILAELSVLVVPSLWDENAPLACLQARAAGLPMVASDVPGIAEVVEEPAHGRLFPPGDAPALARALAAELALAPRRTPTTLLPVSYGEHLERMEELYRSAAAADPLP